MKNKHTIKTAICPKCKDTIENLRYEKEVTHFGTVDLNEDYYDEEDREENEITIFCPDCGEELTWDDINKKKG